MDFSLPFYVENVINKLETNGYKAYIVGGSIRDIILKKIPNDYDIATDALPEDIIRIFHSYKTLEVGKQFGTVVIVQDEACIEVTTFREDGTYLDGRRPTSVAFSKNLKEDLSRRDFTINSLAYNKKEGLVDYFGGIEDIKKGIIRTVGDPNKRFGEDYLRIIRAVRFACQLNFSIEEETLEACKTYSKFLTNISKERIHEELYKILLAGIPSRGIRTLREINALEIIIPEFVATYDFDQHHPYHNRDVFDHIMCVLDHVSPILTLRLAALFHDIGKPQTLSLDENGIGRFYGHDRVGSQMATQILRRLKASNDIIDQVTKLIGSHMSRHNDLSDKGLKRLIDKQGQEGIFNLIDLQKADKLCTKDTDISYLIEREGKIQAILDREEPYSKKHLLINGNDLKEIGYKEGIQIGQILDYLLERVLDDMTLNTKKELINIVNNEFIIDN